MAGTHPKPDRTPVPRPPDGPAAVSPASVEPAGDAGGIRFVNGMRLNVRQWLAVAVLAAATLAGVPPLWKHLEHFEPGPDYRMPYALSKDYWLFERRLQRLDSSQIVVLGDSVVWGEYVRPSGALTHFLNEADSTARSTNSAGPSDRFVNAGVNGLFPLALEGLVRYYAGPVRGSKVLLHCNVLWMSSPKADLQTEKEERFNHADLVPQFSPRIPCYKAELNHRLGAVVERHFPFSEWANHLQVAYFGQKNILAWTLEEDDHTPPRYPNAYRNPLAQITLTVPAEPATDPDRGPESPRHRPWAPDGPAGAPHEGTARFEWVELDRSLQWAAFQRVVRILQSRENDVLVVIGPFNEHLMAPENRAAFRRLRDGIAAWLAQNSVPHAVPATLPSALYADGSHPLTEGYRQLARELASDPSFQAWLQRPGRAP